MGHSCGIRTIYLSECFNEIVIGISSNVYYRPTGVENLAGAGAGVAKIGMPGPGVFNFLINISI